MIPLEEAVERILVGLRPAAPEIVALSEAWGRVTAAPVVARLDQPPRDVSAMDGYAIRAGDGGLDASLRVIGESPAGHPWQGSLGQGEAVRLFTGSVIPQGADTVLLQEDAAREGDRVTVTEAVRPARHIRRQGQDFATGETVIPQGKRLTARDVGLAAAANHPWLRVHQRPRVAILATGDEIALPGEAIPAGGIISSNAHALAALIRAQGATPLILPIAGDSIEAIGDAAVNAGAVDMLVTTGGASVGDHDLVATALAARGLTLDFWKIAMRPGKPLMHGDWRGTPMLGLPGNPVSALVCALRFLVPALARLSGRADTALETETATLATPLPPNDQRADHLRATLAGNTVTPFPVQDSAMLRRLALADALILRPPHDPAREKGDPVTILRLERFGI